MEGLAEALIPLRVQVTVEQLGVLKQTADRAGVSLAELVRQIIDGWREVEENDHDN